MLNNQSHNIIINKLSILTPEPTIPIIVIVIRNNCNSSLYIINRCSNRQPIIKIILKVKIKIKVKLLIKIREIEGIVQLYTVHPNLYLLKSANRLK